MTVDLSVVESLGINLYSNAAAVLTELVANAYDADATHVKIVWRQQSERIVVVDNGTGMTRDELNDRFLKVGYKKRQEEGKDSDIWHRPFMGRKGIGKLSVFSVAETVTVYSTKDGIGNGLRIDVNDLEKAIKNGLAYYPVPLDVPAEFADRGTVLLLDDLKSKRATLTAAALRKRLARRFDVLDQTPEKKGGFYIYVNGKPISYEDRQELKKLEFIWELGDTSLPDHALPSDITRFRIRSATIDAARGWRVGGWIGTTKRPTDLTDDEEAGSLKNIIVIARKRPIQEGIVEKLDFSRIFGNYVTGQIEADFLDLDGGFDDIATSDRQRMIEDDDRVVQLQKFLRGVFVRASDQWSKARPPRQAKDALARYPQLREWVDARPPWQRSAAEAMIGTVASIELEKRDEKSREDLFRAGILAFERLGLRKSAEDLNSLSRLTAAELLPLLGQQDAYEAGMWVDIMRSRIESIHQFRNLASANEKEKVLQKHLFNHLWLLDVSWERATASPRMEEDLRKVHPGVFAVDAKGKQIAGRLDIRYATAVGRHVIVELKRYSVKRDAADLATQGLKYFEALRSILDRQGRGKEEIEIIFVLGSHPGTSGMGRLTASEYIEHSFDPFNGRYVLYDQLIENATRQYQEYLEATDKARALDELLNSLGGDAPGLDE